MTDSFVQIPPDSSGKKIDNSEVLVGTDTVERQRVNISDPEDADGHAAVVSEEPEPHGYALATRTVQGESDASLTHTLLFQILAKLDELVQVQLEK